MTDAYGGSLSRAREKTEGPGDPINPDPWAPENGPTNHYAQLVHFAVWSFVVLLIESGLW